MKQYKCRCIAIYFILFAPLLILSAGCAGINKSAFAPANPKNPLQRRYSDNETLAYIMHGVNRSRQGERHYEAKVIGEVKKDAQGIFYEEFHWVELTVAGMEIILPRDSLNFRQCLSLDPRYKMPFPDISGIHPMLIGPVFDLMTFYVDLWHGMRQETFTNEGAQTYLKTGVSSSWADGKKVLIGEDCIDFKLTLSKINNDAIVLMVSHIPPEKSCINIHADWMETPISSGVPNNWIQIIREADEYIAGVGSETFDVVINASRQSGKIISAVMDNPVDIIERKCFDKDLINCGEPEKCKIFRKIELSQIDNFYESAPSYEAGFLKKVPFPFPAGTRLFIRQGAFGKESHNEAGNEYNWDFEAPFGTAVTAVEAGKVIEVWEPDKGGKCEQSFADFAHNIKIRHSDGTVSQYVHIKSLVKKGQVVKAGQQIAVAGNNGWLCYPHLHFGIYLSEKNLYSSPDRKTVPLFFYGAPNGIIKNGKWYVVPIESAIADNSVTANPPATTFEAVKRNADIFLDKIEKLGYELPYRPEMREWTRPSLISWREEARAVAVPKWEEVSADTREQMALWSSSGTAKDLFDFAFRWFLPIHELAHFLQTEFKSNNSHADNEKIANDVAVAFWCTQPDGKKYLKVFQSMVEKAVLNSPEPAPAGIDSDQYFNDNYDDLSRNMAKYGAYQWRFVLNSLRRAEQLDFGTSIHRIIAKDIPPR